MPAYKTAYLIIKIISIWIELIFTNILSRKQIVFGETKKMQIEKRAIKNGDKKSDKKDANAV